MSDKPICEVCGYPSHEGVCPGDETGRGPFGQDFERAWRRALRARVTELENAIRIHEGRIKRAGPLTGELTSENLDRMARKHRADLALWALLPDTEDRG